MVQGKSRHFNPCAWVCTHTYWHTLTVNQDLFARFDKQVWEIQGKSTNSFWKTLSITFLTLWQSKAETVHRNNNAERSSTQLRKKSQKGLYVQPVYLEIWLIYNFVLVSCIWQSDTDTHTHTHICTYIYGFPGGSGNYILIQISVTILKKVCVCSKIYLLEICICVCVCVCVYIYIYIYI